MYLKNNLNGTVFLESDGLRKLICDRIYWSRHRNWNTNIFELKSYATPQLSQC